jgi:hypothetical protein
MTTYYTKEGNTLKKAGSVIKTSRGWVSNPNAEDYATIGAYPREESSPPPTDEEHRAVPDGYELIDGKWVKLWKVEPIQYTYDDYNRALEDYLREVRSERGYTDREPDQYIGSKVPRWDSDGRDFRDFRDDVMLYALPILNEYIATGNAPSLAEFKAGFPKMVWTYAE